MLNKLVSLPEIRHDRRTYTQWSAGVTTGVKCYLAECGTLGRHRFQWWHVGRLKHLNGTDKPWMENGRTERRYWMPSHRLSQYSIHVRQRWPVLKVWQSLLPHNSVDFRLGATLNLLVVHHEINEHEQCGTSLSGSSLTFHLRDPVH
jgi:hypothetical protein